MRSLANVSLAELLPHQLLTDPFISAFIEAFDTEFHLLVQDTAKILLYQGLNTQPHAVLDYLAWQFNVEFYDQAFSLTEKRELISNALYWHSVKGTPHAVERVVEIVFGQGIVEEWFTYGGNPFHFRVQAEGGFFPTVDKYNTLIRMVESVKRKTAILQVIQILQSGQQDLKIAGAQHVGQYITIGSDTCPVFLLLL